MKKLLVILTILVTFSATGQNLQLHYDFERGFYMSTFEMFRIDKYGFSYAFVDFDYDAKNGISRGHEKIVRVLKTEKMPLGLEVAYEGIVGTYEYPGGTGGFSPNTCWIFGVNYARYTPNWGFTFSPGYKKIKNVDNFNYIVNGTWYLNFFKRKLTFNGVIEFWSEEGFTDNIVFNSEPQVWFNATQNLSIGSEVKITNNRGNEKFEVRPSIALKWIFGDSFGGPKDKLE